MQCTCSGGVKLVAWLGSLNAQRCSGRIVELGVRGGLGAAGKRDRPVLVHFDEGVCTCQ